MNKISVIIPIYNAEKYLSNTVECLKRQTYHNFEVLLVNDGSTDNSAVICEQFAREDARFRCIHQANQGVSAARNNGLAVSTGDYITFIDADDIIPENYLLVLLEACADADISVCDVVSLHGDKELVRFTHPQCMMTQTEAMNLLLTRRKINSGPCAKLFRREILDGLSFPPLKAYEDIVFIKNVFCRAKCISVTDQTEYRYIQNPAGAMSSFVKAPSMDIIRATEDLLVFIISRLDLDPDTFYITVSHLMQYIQYLTQRSEGRQFILESQKLYRKFLKNLLYCSAFPFKEKIIYLMFVGGWLYYNKKFIRI